MLNALWIVSTFCFSDYLVSAECLYHGEQVLSVWMFERLRTKGWNGITDPNITFNAYQLHNKELMADSESSQRIRTVKAFQTVLAAFPVVV